MWNFVVKFRKNNNYYYIVLIKDLSGLFKNELGLINYVFLVEVFGLVWVIIVLCYSFEICFDFGINC